MIDLQKFEIPGNVSVVVGQGGLPKVVIETASRTAEIYLHGAHITHFQKKGEPPILFMSAASDFTAGKPIRGGVPIIFPWFGSHQSLPSHGFARTSTWDLVETSRRPDGAVSLRFLLPTTESFEAEYLVTVAESLTMELSVTNTADHDFTFESCLHAYFQISAIDAVSITGLSGVSFFNHLSQRMETETAAEIHIASEVDRSYFDTTAAIEIADSGWNRKIRIEKSGSKSTVVWNPWIEKSKLMADFGDAEYLLMVCVEPGNIAQNQITLPPQGNARLKVQVSSASLDC
jgi:D-hexose-6-phosphate mutarotase